MALVTNELFSSAPGVGSQKRIGPRVIKVKEFAIEAGSPTIPKGALVSYETGAVDGWGAFRQAGANGAELMRGIAWPDDIELSATGEVLGQVMLRGLVHRDDIELNGETQPNVDIQLQTLARDLGIDVEGLADVR